MAMDGLSLAAVCCELSCLVGGKIDKVNQPERDLLLLGVRAGGANHKLLLSAAADNCRVQLTKTAPPNPMDPPMFCMLLRKRIMGGRILSVEQPDLDRTLIIGIEARNELGDTVTLRLIAEVMGKHSNVILVNEQGIVQDAIRHVGISQSRVRMVLPGCTYEPAPPQVKQDPRTASREDFFAALAPEGRADKQLSAAFFGLAPTIAAELCRRSVGDVPLSALTEGQKVQLAEDFATFYADVREGRFCPHLLLDDFGAAIAVYPFKPAFSEAFLRPAENMGDALDAFYADRDLRESLRRKSASLLKILQNNVERCAKKAELYREDLAAGERMDLYRLYGELLTANLHCVKKGSREAILDNYYEDPPKKIAVPLDESRSPSENAQRYFKKYQKARAAKSMAEGRLKEAMEELTYLEGQLDNLDKCTTLAELNELREELVKEGYVRPQPVKNKPQKAPPSKPLHYVSCDGIDIYVGKNNVQNDMLTLRFASPEDMWMHTKEIPGSHVIIKHPAESIPDSTLQEAANLAAYYSRARQGSMVPVDYTPKKFVKKPSGAKPGMVIYTTNRTAYITPDEAKVKRMRIIE